MDAKKCDRCGAFYEKEKEHSNGGMFFDKIYKINSYISNGSNLCAVFDLCPDCRKAFEEFMKGGKR